MILQHARAILQKRGAILQNDPPLLQTCGVILVKADANLQRRGSSLDFVPANLDERAASAMHSLSDRDVSADVVHLEPPEHRPPGPEYLPGDPEGRREPAFKTSPAQVKLPHRVDIASVFDTRSRSIFGVPAAYFEMPFLLSEDGNRAAPEKRTP